MLTEDTPAGRVQYLGPNSRARCDRKAVISAVAAAIDRARQRSDADDVKPVVASTVERLAVVRGRLDRGPAPMLELQVLRDRPPREDRAHHPLCAAIDEFSLHVAVRVEAHGRMRLE